MKYNKVPLYIRATHKDGFRSGQWFKLIDVSWDNYKPVYVVEGIDGVIDAWPIYDPSDPYEIVTKDGVKP